MNDKIEEWRRGNETKLLPLQRMVLHNEWLKKQHQDVRDNIYKKYEQPEEKITEGFPKD